MDQARGFEGLEQLPHEAAVIDVALHKMVAVRFAEVLKIACICELIEVDHQALFLLVPMQDKVGTYETGAACDKNGLRHFSETSLEASGAASDAVAIGEEQGRPEASGCVIS